MDMLIPDWQQERPPNSAVDAMWQEIEIRQWPLDGIDRTLAVLRQVHTNGGALFARFRISPHSVLQWFGARNRWSELDFFRRLFRLPVFSSTLPEVGAVSARFAFEQSSTFALECDVADLIFRGGAYGSFFGTGFDAKVLAAEFSRRLIEERFNEVDLYRSFQGWSEWFHGLAWDRSWIVIDKRYWSISILCVTDSD